MNANFFSDTHPVKVLVLPKGKFVAEFTTPSTLESGLISNRQLVHTLEKGVYLKWQTLRKRG